MSERSLNFWAGIIALVTIFFVGSFLKGNPDKHRAQKVAMPAKVVKHNRPENWQKHQQRATIPVVPAVSVPLDTTPTSTTLSPTVSAVDTNVPPGHKRVRITLVGTGFAQSNQTSQVNQNK